ncbi:uncharacterized protein LOC126810460 isoform X1 [Patella vulgata]|uniref:uncharacterized protein LOC126810460 isoform X1 n=1 Tax=Patella vulgata TaxID=6465 RepID=UPI00217F591C|nr:uncharacterized protein LOC126810460 isoform X1 [Patella vulgata]
MGVGQVKRAWFCIQLIISCVPGVSAALDEALIGVIAASAVLGLFTLIAIIFTACYCHRLIEKKRLEKNQPGLRRLPEDYSTVSGYVNYGYPDNWFYTDPYFYGHPKQLGSYRPKVLTTYDEGVEESRREHDERRVKTMGDVPEGHVIEDINHKVIKKTHKRLSDWLNSNYGETGAAMDIGQEEDDDLPLTAHQTRTQNIPPGSYYKDDGEFTIIDYVDDGRSEKNERRQSTTPDMFERQAQPLPPAFMPNQYKTTIGVVQERTSKQLEQWEIREGDHEDFPALTSSPVPGYRNENGPFNPATGIIADGAAPSQNSVGFDYNNPDGDSFESHRQRVANMGSVPILPPDEYDSYKDFMADRLKQYE